MVCISLNGVLYVSPPDAFRTIAGRGKLVLEAVGFDVIAPLDGVVLISGHRPAAKVEGIALATVQ